MLTSNADCKLCTKGVGFMHNDLDPLVHFFFAVKCTGISTRVIVHLWEVGVGIIKLQNDSFCSVCFPRVTRKSRLLLSLTLEIWLSGLSLALTVGYFGTVHLSSNCSPAEEWFRSCCLDCDILCNHPVVLVWDVHRAFSCLTQEKSKEENSGISSSLFLGLWHTWCAPRSFPGFGIKSKVSVHELPWFIATWTKLGMLEGQKVSRHCCFIVVLSRFHGRFASKPIARAVVRGPAFNMTVIRAETKPVSAEPTPGITLVHIKRQTYDSVTEHCLTFWFGNLSWWWWL